MKSNTTAYDIIILPMRCVQSLAWHKLFYHFIHLKLRFSTFINSQIFNFDSQDVWCVLVLQEEQDVAFVASIHSSGGGSCSPM